MEEKYSFKEFLTKETYIGLDPDTEEEVMGVVSKIEIPMIQRDYAQGRVKEYKGTDTIINDTGSKFLKSIFNALKDNAEMELEFIYGSVEERPIMKSREKEYAYIPLDGQQRLTTLFLLYWYLGMRELSIEAGERKKHLDLLKKFTYLTRTSSRIFCECICDNEKMENMSLGVKNPSFLIENCPWYYKEYKKDPTVKAMLAMMDHIDMLYNTENSEGAEYFHRLENLKFYAFPLNKYKLTEDLYIKMNARGKQLSGYENFKADLINWMKSKTNPDYSRFNQDVTYRGREMKYYMAFVQKMDNEWTDIFWDAIKNNEDVESSLDGKVVDNMFMRFFIRFFFNERILHLQKTTDLPDEIISNDELVKYFYGDNGIDISVVYNNNDFEDKYKECLSFEVIRKIEAFFDGIIGKLYIINREFLPSWQRDTKSKDDSFYAQKISWQGRIIFQATINYFTQNVFEETAYCDWIKTVWNFVVDPTIRNIKDNIGTLKFIDDLSKHSDNIIDWMAATPEGSRLKTQFAEEHIKAILVKKDPEWRKLLIEGEKHSLLKGRIMFLLSDKENTKKATYKKHLEITRCLIPNSKNDYLWIRAILSHVEEYNISAAPLTLSDVRENWKTIISDNLMVPMQSLLNDLQSYIDENNVTINGEIIYSRLQEICNNYETKDGLEWLYPLVSWQVGDYTLLGTDKNKEIYSESRKIEEREGNVYLCYKTTLQPDSCILLTSARDKIINQILPLTDKEFEWMYTSYHCNIHDTFFRGMNVTLFRNKELNGIGSLKCAYIFNSKQLLVGVRYADNPVIADEDNHATWACSKIFDISGIRSNESIQAIVEQTENEVFNLDNQDSLLFKFTEGERYNDVQEMETQEQSSSPKGLRIIFPNGDVISNRWAIEAFIDTLKRIGLERIPPVGIKHSGYNLVSMDKRPDGNWQREVNGWFIYSNISNDVKCDDLRKISNSLNLGLIVEDGIE